MPGAMCRVLELFQGKGAFTYANRSLGRSAIGLDLSLDASRSMDLASPPGFLSGPWSLTAKHSKQTKTTNNNKKQTHKPQMKLLYKPVLRGAPCGCSLVLSVVELLPGSPSCLRGAAWQTTDCFSSACCARALAYRHVAAHARAWARPVSAQVRLLCGSAVAAR